MHVSLSLKQCCPLRSLIPCSFGRGFKFAELQISMFSLSLAPVDLTSPAVFSEVVVSILLENLVFEPSSYNIVWRTSITAKPVTKGRENETSHLPLRVSLAKAVST
jgi:hypothetical protein